MTEHAAPVPAALRAGPGVAAAAAEGRIERAIRDFQAGRDREGAFRVLYETYFHPLQRFFARKGFAPDECLDLTQETFLGIYRGLKGYEHRQRFAAWLYQVATTVFLKRVRRAAAAKRSAVEVSRDGMESPEPGLAVPGRQLDRLVDRERRRTLREAVAELPEQMRECLTLRLDRQLAYHEIATIKRISIETVKAHLFRARKKLRERLAGLELEDLEE